MLCGACLVVAINNLSMPLSFLSIVGERKRAREWTEGDKSKVSEDERQLKLIRFLHRLSPIFSFFSFDVNEQILDILHTFFMQPNNNNNENNSRMAWTEDGKFHGHRQRTVSKATSHIRRMKFKMIPTLFPLIINMVIINNWIIQFFSLFLSLCRLRLGDINTSLSRIKNNKSALSRETKISSWNL